VPARCFLPQGDIHVRPQAVIGFRRNTQLRRTWRPSHRLDARRRGTSSGCGLYRAVRRRGLPPETAGTLLTFMDWVLDLPEDLDDRFWNEVRVEEETEAMRYMTRLEERAEDRGKSLGIEEGKALGLLMGKAAGMRESLLFLLEGKFGVLPGDVRQRVEAIADADRLSELMGRILDVTSIEKMGI